MLLRRSREEPQIKAALSKFNPRELRTDEAKQAADVEFALRTTARKYVKGEVRMADIEAAVKREFGVDMKGAMEALQGPVNASKALYDDAVLMMKAEGGLDRLQAISEKLNKGLSQQSKDFAVVYAQANEAQKILTEKVATEWELDQAVRGPDGLLFLRHPAKGKAARWVDDADNPGVKGEERAKQKVENDYDDDASKLKDLARLTLLYSDCSRMADALDSLEEQGFKVLQLKNKFANPTPMGYRDLNLCLGVLLADSTHYVCEVQINHKLVAEAKHRAHKPYEIVRTELPELCKASGVDTKQAEKLEAFIVGRLNSSALDVAVAALSAKAEGLFLYAHLLAQHLESEAALGHEIRFDSLDSLPAGLADVYAVNFSRAFPAGASDGGWAAARPLVELIAAAMEPIGVEMAAALLGWDVEEKERALELTGLLFPVRDGKFHVFHKTVVDWLTGEITEGSSLAARSADFEVRRRDGHARFGEGFIEWLQTKAGGTPEYFLQHGVTHLCRAGTYTALAAEVYATDLDLLERRIDAGMLGRVASDFLELSAYGVDHADSTQMRRFVGKYTDVLQRERGRAVAQLAQQQPDASVVHRALEKKGAGMGRMLKWRNKPQQPDPCIATLAHPAEVKALGVSKTRIVSGAGNVVYLYNAATQEPLEELLGESRVTSIAIFEHDGQKGTGWIAVGYENGTIQVWDSGAKPTQPLAVLTILTILGTSTNTSPR